MSIQAKSLREVRANFQNELQHLYSDSELNTILKTLYQKSELDSSMPFILALDEQLSPSDLVFFFKILARLKNKEPFQYVIGETAFYGLLLKSDSRALIPRPETEELVDWILKSSRSNNIVDLCSGSGCIAFALKSNLPQSNVVAVEWSDDALALIKENKVGLGLDIEVLKADVLNANYDHLMPVKVDVIVSNPPYIPLKDRSRMESNVLDHEPEMALFVENDDPMIFYREIIERSTSILSSEGWIYFEIHEDLADAVVDLLHRNKFVNIEVRKDLQDKERMVRGQRVSFGP